MKTKSQGIWRLLSLEGPTRNSNGYLVRPFQEASLKLPDSWALAPRLTDQPQGLLTPEPRGWRQKEILWGLREESSKNSAVF